MAESQVSAARRRPQDRTSIGALGNAAPAGVAFAAIVIVGALFAFAGVPVAAGENSGSEGSDAVPRTSIEGPGAAPKSSDSKLPLSDAARIQEPAGSASSFAESICLGLARASLANNIPVDFFTRLIWQESHFDARARSYAGAQGIAQFMPATARGRGLADPFDPLVALHESARFLGELRNQFGNLGLAAAAYNAGPGRVEGWLDRRAPLPAQTRAYVKIITGRAAEEWIGAADRPEDRMGTVIPCDEIARLLSRQQQEPAASKGNPALSAAANITGPWVLQLTSNSSESAALAEYRGLQKKYPSILGDRQPLVVRSRVGSGSAISYLVQVAESTRERANQLCAKLQAAGARCIVTRN